MIHARWGAALLFLAIGGCSDRGAGPPSGSETSVDACSDGRDNDGDGATDCADVACRAFPFCTGDMDAGPGVGVDAGVGPRDAGPPVDAMLPLCTAPIDVVFVIDVSTSMADELGRIRTGIASIWAAARALTADTQFSMIVFVDDFLAVNTCAPFDTVEAMQAEFDSWRAFCASNNNPGGSPGSNQDCPENSLDALYRAAECPWRTGATRILIHVTDDTFEERPATLSGLFGGGVAVQRTYDEVVNALMGAEIRVGAFAAPGAGEECGAGASANVGQGFHEAYMGRAAIPMATGGRAWSIRDVRAGTLDMAEAINALIEAEYCTLY